MDSFKIYNYVGRTFVYSNSQVMIDRISLRIFGYLRITRVTTRTDPIILTWHPNPWEPSRCEWRRRHVEAAAPRLAALIRVKTKPDRRTGRKWVIARRQDAGRRITGGYILSG